MNRLVLFASATLLGAPAAPLAAVLFATDSQNLYSIDTEASFAITTVGPYASSSAIGGLEFSSEDVLYGISAGGSAHLYTVDPSNAVTTAIGTLDIGYLFEGGLAFDPVDGTLYGVNRGNAAEPFLFTIDLLTGQGTLVGQIAGGSHDFGGITFEPSGQLYGLDRVTNGLWRIDKVDPFGPGTAFVGSLGSGIVMGDTGGMTRDPGSGIVYGVSAGSRHLFTVDLATGAGTVLHELASGDPPFRSLAIRMAGPISIESSTWGSLKARYRER